MAYVPVTNAVKAGAGTPTTTTPAVDTTGANLITVVLTHGTGDTHNFTDSKGNTWNLRTRISNGGSSILILDCLNPTAGSGHTFSSTMDYSSLSVTAQSGAHASAAYDQESGASSFGEPQAPGALTPTEDNSYLFSGVGWQSTDGGVTPAVTGGFTIPNWAPYNGSNMYFGTSSAYLIQTSKASANPSWNPAGTSGLTSAVMAIYKAAAGGTANTLAMGQGTFTITGQTVGLKVTRRLQPAQGTFTLTGQALGLTVQRKALTAVQGSFAITGQALAMRVARSPLVATQGSYALTGQALVMRVARAAFPIGQGSFVLTGQAVSLKVTRAFVAAQGTFALTGQSVGLSYVRTVSLGQGNYALTGQTLGLTVQRRLTMGQGLFTATGEAVTLTATQPTVAVAYSGKYAPEHASALSDIGAATGFSAEHAPALQDIGDAGR